MGGRVDVEYTVSYANLLQEAARTGDIYTIRARSKFSHGSIQENGEDGVAEAPFVSTFISAVRCLVIVLN